tara:strand:+ start:307 stop:690 length:384 start_codon:yes stop_codon:yes gene_type:complete
MPLLAIPSIKRDNPPQRGIMRKIERAMIQCIIDEKSMNKANTRVEYEKNYRFNFYLHGHKIAVYYPQDRNLHLNNCGYETNTTKSRLNALIKFVLGGTSGIYQDKFNWYLKKDKEVSEFPCNEWIAV